MKWFPYNWWCFPTIGDAYFLFLKLWTSELLKKGKATNKAWQNNQYKLMNNIKYSSTGTFLTYMQFTACIQKKAEYWPGSAG